MVPFRVRGAQRAARADDEVVLSRVSEEVRGWGEGAGAWWGWSGWGWGWGEGGEEEVSWLRSGGRGGLGIYFFATGSCWC